MGENWIHVHDSMNVSLSVKNSKDLIEVKDVVRDLLIPMLSK